MLSFDGNFGRLSLKDVERRVAHRGEVYGAVILLGSTAVLAEGHVERPMQIVLDAPMGAARGEKALRVAAVHGECLRRSPSRSLMPNPPPPEHSGSHQKSAIARRKPRPSTSLSRAPLPQSGLVQTCVCCGQHKHVTMRLYIAAARSPPRSEPQRSDLGRLTIVSQFRCAGGLRQFEHYFADALEAANRAQS